MNHVSGFAALGVWLAALLPPAPGWAQPQEESAADTEGAAMPLRKFFTGGTHTDSGEEMSWDSIKAALKEIIDAEDKQKPLSDDALAAALKERGIEIARRTVAKYRDQLGVPTARLRKEF